MSKHLLKIFIITSLLFSILNIKIFSQSPDTSKGLNLYPFIVDSIKINGNDITEDFIILRELSFSKGDTLTKDIAFYNRERIYSLGIFNRVNLVPEKINKKNILNINVEESWYIYPIPFIDAKENDISKLSYGLYLKIKNFRGRNEELGTAFSLGYDPSFQIYYRSPSLIDAKNVYLELKTGYSDVTNKSPTAEFLYGSQFSQKYIYFQFMIGRRFGLFHRLYLTSSYNYIETPFYIPKINASNDRIDNRIDLGFGYEYDTRDLIQFPKNGIYTNLQYTFKGLGINDINYGVGWIDFREYRNLFDKLVAKWRLASRLTVGNNVPYYDYSILGLEDRIRGHFTQKIEGDNYYFAGLEFNYPIIEEIHLNLKFIPIIPDKLLSYRIGFYTQMFIETGAAQIKGQPFTFSNFKSGYGAGFTLLILPYNVLRVDFALNEYKKFETILTLGISY